MTIHDLKAKYSPPNVNYWGDRCCKAEAKISEIRQVLDYVTGINDDRDVVEILLSLKNIVDLWETSMTEIIDTLNWPPSALEAIERLRERCEAYKGQVKCGAEEMERLRAAKDRIIAASKYDSANGTFTIDGTTLLEIFATDVVEQEAPTRNDTE